ncbi:MAG: hypothetical protein WCI03_11255 [bacterium]
MSAAIIMEGIVAAGNSETAKLQPLVGEIRRSKRLQFIRELKGQLPGPEEIAKLLEGGA